MNWDLFFVFCGVPFIIFGIAMIRSSIKMQREADQVPSGPNWSDYYGKFIA